MITTLFNSLLPFQALAIALVIAFMGIGLLSYSWKKYKELSAIALPMANSRFKRKEWEENKDLVGKHVRFYYLLIFLGLFLLAFAFYLIITYDYANLK